MVIFHSKSFLCSQHRKSLINLLKMASETMGFTSDASWSNKQICLQINNVQIMIGLWQSRDFKESVVDISKRGDG